MAFQVRMLLETFMGFEKPTWISTIYLIQFISHLQVNGQHNS